MARSNPSLPMLPCAQIVNASCSTRTTAAIYIRSSTARIADRASPSSWICLMTDLRQRWQISRCVISVARNTKIRRIGASMPSRWRVPIVDRLSNFGNLQSILPRSRELICGYQPFWERANFCGRGGVPAIKGLGGFHLACDATNEKAVAELRRRKGRAGKPFAVMFADLNTVTQFCILGKVEMILLNGYEKPIVLLNRRTGTKIAPSVAPQMDTLGVMLPYTPLHHLLVNQSDPILRREPAPPVLVMTSGNFSEEPIATENQDALERLGPLADAFLLHNRDIHIRCDDSVVRVDHRQNGRNNEGQQPEIIHLRRSRAYAPYPVSLPFDSVPSLAVGGELKNTFCLTRDRYAFLSHHIGDMENAEVYESFEQGVEHLNRLFRVKPELIAHDMHPGYFTTQYAERITDIPRVPVQHHHAHIAACMTDNGLTDRKVIGLSFDGTGYGTDGKIWGGEVLLASYADFERFAIRPVSSP